MLNMKIDSITSLIWSNHIFVETLWDMELFQLSFSWQCVPKPRKHNTCMIWCRNCAELVAIFLLSTWHLPFASSCVVYLCRDIGCHIFCQNFSIYFWSVSTCHTKSCHIKRSLTIFQSLISIEIHGRAAWGIICSCLWGVTCPTAQLFS
jgi:hypothetical protein